ncbi:MAG: diacylglycerol/polyprenol kinase family protein [Candidatus Hodarchaeota archaeon]
MALLNDFYLVIGAFIYVAGIIAVSLMLKKKDIISKHAARKIVHLFAGFACFIVPFLTYPHLALIVSLTFLLLIRISNPKTPLFQMMGEKGEEVEKGYLSGPFSYALAINILVIIFGFMPQYFFFPASSIMVMMISDTAASFVGRRWGKHKINNFLGINLAYTKTTRSLEGSLALFLSAFGLSLLAFSFFGSWFPKNENTMGFFWIIILSLLLAFNSALIELVSPSNLDDFIMPITSCFLTFLMTVFLFPGAIGATQFVFLQTAILVPIGLGATIILCWIYK